MKPKQRTEAEDFAKLHRQQLTDDDLINLLPVGEWEIDPTLEFARAVIQADRSLRDD
jgi:hypothetical protein